MSSDHFERQMEFIVEQQAKFVVSIGRLEEDLAELKVQTGENTANIAKLADMILSLANYNEQQDERIAALIEHSQETDRRFRETDQRFRETDDRINVLIKVAERFFGGNGK